MKGPGLNLDQSDRVRIDCPPGMTPKADKFVTEKARSHAVAGGPATAGRRFQPRVEARQSC